GGREARVPGDQHQEVRHPSRRAPGQRGRAEEYVGAAQSAAPDGRDRRHRVPARPPQADQDQRRVLRLNETQVTRLLYGNTKTAPAGAVFRGWSFVILTRSARRVLVILRPATCEAGHEIQGPARLYRATGTARRTQAHP